MQQTEKERLYNAGKREAVDRPPLICPGGMMNAVTAEMVEIAQIPFPQAHSDSSLMAQIARSTHDLSGLENYGVPFCMTVEAEAMGALVDFGDALCEPHVVKGIIQSVRDFKSLKPLNPQTGRPKAILEAIEQLANSESGVPVIGNLTGPVSVAGTLLDCEVFLREMRKYPEETLEYLEFVASNVAAFGKAMVDAGADCVCIAEPTGTGELLGPRYFDQFSVQFLNQVLDAVQAPLSIVHICGNMKPVIDSVKDIHCDIFSFDAMTPVEKVHEAAPNKSLMGNVSTFALSGGDVERVASITRASIKHGVNVVAPACGIATVTPLANLKAMKQAVVSSAASSVSL